MCFLYDETNCLFALPDLVDVATLQVLGQTYFQSPTFAGVNQILDTLVEETCKIAPPGKIFPLSRIFNAEEL